MFSSFVLGGTITINTIVPFDTQVIFVGGATEGNVVVNTAAGHVPLDPFHLLSFTIRGVLTFNNVLGPITPLQASVDSLPVRSKVTLTGNTRLTRLNDACGLAYTPANPADWAAPLPQTVQAGLDRLARAVVTVSGSAIPDTTLACAPDFPMTASPLPPPPVSLRDAMP